MDFRVTRAAFAPRPAGATTGRRGQCPGDGAETDFRHQGDQRDQARGQDGEQVEAIEVRQAQGLGLPGPGRSPPRPSTGHPPGRRSVAGSTRSARRAGSSTDWSSGVERLGQSGQVELVPPLAAGSGTTDVPTLPPSFRSRLYRPAPAAAVRGTGTGRRPCSAGRRSSTRPIRWITCGVIVLARGDLQVVVGQHVVAVGEHDQARRRSATGRRPACRAATPTTGSMASDASPDGDMTSPAFRASYPMSDWSIPGNSMSVPYSTPNTQTDDGRAGGEVAVAEDAARRSPASRRQQRPGDDPADADDAPTASSCTRPNGSPNQSHSCALAEHDLQAAEPERRAGRCRRSRTAGRRRGLAPAALQVRRVLDQRPSQRQGEQAGRDVDVEDPPPRVVVGDPAAEGRARGSGRPGRPCRRRPCAGPPLRREGVEQDRLRDGWSPPPASPWTHAEGDQLRQAGGHPAERRGQR